MFAGSRVVGTEGKGFKHRKAATGIGTAWTERSRDPGRRGGRCGALGYIHLRGDKGEEGTILGTILG